jgi:hypothetical protein
LSDADVMAVAGWRSSRDMRARELPARGRIGYAQRRRIPRIARSSSKVAQTRHTPKPSDCVLALYHGSFTFSASVKSPSVMRPVFVRSSGVRHSAPPVVRQ